MLTGTILFLKIGANTFGTTLSGIYVWFPTLNVFIGSSVFGTIAFLVASVLFVIFTGIKVVPPMTTFFTVSFVIGSTCKSLILRTGVVTLGFFSGITTFLKYGVCTAGTALRGMYVLFPISKVCNLPVVAGVIVLFGFEGLSTFLTGIYLIPSITIGLTVRELCTGAKFYPLINKTLVGAAGLSTFLKVGL